jgi:hypothetical protein
VSKIRYTPLSSLICVSLHRKGKGKGKGDDEDSSLRRGQQSKTRTAV